MLILFIFEGFTIICYISGMITRKPSEYPDTTVGREVKKLEKAKNCDIFQINFYQKLYGTFQLQCLY